MVPLVMIGIMGVVIVISRKCNALEKRKLVGKSAQARASVRYEWQFYSEPTLTKQRVPKMDAWNVWPFIAASRPLVVKCVVTQEFVLPIPATALPVLERHVIRVVPVGEPVAAMNGVITVLVLFVVLPNVFLEKRGRMRRKGILALKKWEKS